MAARRKARALLPKRRRNSAARPSISPDPGIREQLAARRYTGRWHRVLAWATRALSLAGYDDVESVEPGEQRRRARVWGGSYYRLAKDSNRVEQHAVARVRDLTDAEEAYERGLGLELLDSLPAGPGRQQGGIRRVVITALTWTPDDAGAVAYDPAWITLGHGMTARTAAAAAARFVRDYTRALHARTYSRELIFTALEIKFWTARTSADHV